MKLETFLEQIEAVADHSHYEPTEDNEYHSITYTGMKKKLPKIRKIAKEFGIEVTKGEAIGEIESGKRKIKLYQSNLIFDELADDEELLNENTEDEDHIHEETGIETEKQEDYEDLQAEIESLEDTFEEDEEISEESDGDVFEEVTEEAPKKPRKRRSKKTKPVTQEYEDETYTNGWILSGYDETNNRDGTPLKKYEKVTCPNCDYSSRWYAKRSALDKILANHKCPKTEEVEDLEEIEETEE